ncbi:hypothetical protein VC83_07948 [Pseudogymnoascus destructans]|uniref:Vacuolar membrane protein n=2 Tax=Pseudogymnoascus destructans TaxID=655981 RepID=L8GAT1_PSED2|nr:uncharacterized protein VC83_07948 [Pseudogymnoascus destructans]ELR10325.1 hypothetical protein GMDG_04707 [Pseudogymnoascus destructans 20631-21]OAF55932.1 hypothetical protein VC83_07948 [Pseudogymnoascus destructans]
MASPTTTPTSVLAALASSSAAATTASVTKKGECELLGPFALLVQLALGGLALLALVFKRWRERPQRLVKVWAFDVSKQVVGSVLLHAANLVMSMLSSGRLSMKVEDVIIEARDESGIASRDPNPCSFYFLNLLIDTTIGIPILIFFLHVLTRLFLLTPLGEPPQSIESGNYGSPPRAKWWAKQSLIYFLGLLSMKFIVLLIFIFLPWISHIGDWALRWTEGNEKLQVFFVMLFFPVVMNATQYYIIDTFIKGKLEGLEGGRGVEDPVDSDDEGGSEADGLLAAEVEVVKKKRKTSNDVVDSGSGGSSRSEAVRAKLLTESEEGGEDADERVWLTQDQRDERR